MTYTEAIAKAQQENEGKFGVVLGEGTGPDGNYWDVAVYESEKDYSEGVKEGCSDRMVARGMYPAC